MTPQKVTDRYIATVNYLQNQTDEGWQNLKHYLADQEGLHERPINRVVVVYQAGLCNVFSVDCFNMRAWGRKETLLLQGTFAQCEQFARGIAATGVPVASAFCNMAGDISRQNWSDQIEDAPFYDQMSPVWHKVAR